MWRYGVYSRIRDVCNSQGVVFFFVAADGIRGAEESCGLGDV